MQADKAQRARREIKYLINEDQALAVRACVSCYLDPDEFAVGRPDNSYPVHTLYLDSDLLYTFHATVNGDRNRFKLRIRYYDDDPSAPVFFEVKRRINEQIIKQRARVKREAVATLLEGGSPRPEFLYSGNPQQWVDMLDFWNLVERLQAAPRAHNSYMREAYMSPNNTSVRVTMDRVVRLGPEFGGALQTAMPNGIEVYTGFVILELKFTELMPTWMIEMIRGFDLKTSGAKKYVLGLELLGLEKVRRRQTAFEWGQAITSTATSAPWLDASQALLGSIGPKRE